jgi:hypothetical protein
LLCVRNNWIVIIVVNASALISRFPWLDSLEVTMSIRRAPSNDKAGDLEESLAALSVLEENLKKTDALTQKMATLLSTVFDARLGKLEENIKPMYNTTRNLTQISQSTLTPSPLVGVVLVLGGFAHVLTYRY